jgi:putative (di)nucleoside polyphosphate hydrolase
MAPRFRPNVCTVLIDPDTRRVLVFRRVDTAPGGPVWQFPQGGVGRGESPRDAMLRELKEEIGTSRVKILARSREPIRYRFPPDVLERLAREKPEKRGFVGQEQTWFLATLLDGESSIRFDHQPAEFDAFRWVTPEEALAGIVPFKEEAYREGLRELGLLPEAGTVGEGER